MMKGYYAAHRRYVLCFDVRDDRRRARLVKRLRDFGDRVQRSVFEAVLDDAGFQRLQAAVEKTIDPGEDSFFAYRLCPPCEARVLRLGRQDAPHDGREAVFLA